MGDGKGKGGRERDVRWMMGRAMSASERRVFSSMSSSSESSSSSSSSWPGRSRSSVESTKPTPAGPLVRLPLRLRVTTPVPAGLVVEARPLGWGLFLPKRRGTEAVDERSGFCSPLGLGTSPARMASRRSGVSLVP